MVEAPQSFIVREECEKAASQNGFRRVLGQNAGWATFASTTADGTVHLAAAGPRGPWFVALDHVGVAAELGLPAADMAGPAQFCFCFDKLGALYEALRRIYLLTVSLPDAPLREFQAQTAELPRSTDAERQVVERIGQDIFRARLMDYWQGRCPLTGISDPELLRASHIIAWKDCGSDAERLDVHNGLLLSALWDAAFDRGLVTFSDSGQPEFSIALSQEARHELRWRRPIPLNDQQKKRMAVHRERYFIKG